MESTNIYHLNLYNYLINNGSNPVLLNSIETGIIKRNKTDKIDSESIAKYLIISNNNTINMEYSDLREYVNTYFRLTKKLTAVKNSLIRDLDLLYLNDIINRYKCKVLQ